MAKAAKIRLVNRTISVLGGGLIVVTLAYLFVTGSSLFGVLLTVGLGAITGYASVHLASQALVSTLSARGQWAWTATMSLIVAVSLAANAVLATGLAAGVYSAPRLFVGGLFFGSAFAAVIRLFGPPLGRDDH